MSASGRRSVYRNLAECGVEIHEYQPTMLHAKTMVIDNCLSSIGTVNFDNRSFQLNEEITLCAFDPERWQDRGLAQRGLERAGALMRREL